MAFNLLNAKDRSPDSDKNVKSVVLKILGVAIPSLILVILIGRVFNFNFFLNGTSFAYFILG